MDLYIKAYIITLLGKHWSQSRNFMHLPKNFQNYLGIVLIVWNV